PVPVRQERRGTANQKRVRPLSHHGGEGAIEFLRTSCFHVLKADAQRAGGSFQLSLLSCKTWVCPVPEDGYSGGVRDSLLQDLQLLAEDLRTWREGRARYVPAWPPQAGDKSHLNRITGEDHDNGNAARRILCRQRS